MIGMVKEPNNKCALELDHKEAVIEGKIRQCQLRNHVQECRSCGKYPDRYREKDNGIKWPEG